MESGAGRVKEKHGTEKSGHPTTEKIVVVVRLTHFHKGTHKLPIHGYLPDRTIRAAAFILVPIQVFDKNLAMWVRLKGSRDHRGSLGERGIHVDPLPVHQAKFYPTSSAPSSIALFPKFGDLSAGGLKRVVIGHPAIRIQPYIRKSAYDGDSYENDRQ
jgi:hypothetical protein